MLKHFVRSACVALFVGTASMQACAAGPSDRPIELVYDPCGTVVLPAVDATAEERAGVDEALRLWNEAAGLRLSQDGDGTPLEVQFIRTLPALFGSYDDRGGTILINRSIVDPETRAVVIAHELGHAFGMVHVAEEHGASLMRAGNRSVPPMPADVERLRGLWDDCI